MFFLFPYPQRQNSVPYLIFRTNGDGTIQNLLYEMYYECNHPIAYTRHMLNNKMSELFIYLLRYHQNHLISDVTRSQCTDAILPMLQYIQTHYAEVTLSDLSKVFHYKPAYISQVIRRETGQTFSQLKQAMRLQRAAELLTATDRSIRDIAAELGFSDQSHFTRLFHTVYNCTPKAYRNTPFP